MSTSNFRAVFFFPMFLILGCVKPETNTPTSGRVALLASESIAPLVTAEAREFERIYPSVSISVTATTAREAFVNLLNDSVAAIAVDRPLNADERSVVRSAQLNFIETKIGTDAFVVIVNRSSALNAISIPFLGKILASQIQDWQEFPGSGLRGPIVLVLPGRNSGIYELLQNRFTPPGTVMKPSIVARTLDEIAGEVSKNRSAIGVVTAGWYESLRSKANNLPFRALAIAIGDSTFFATQMSVYDGSYPLLVPLYFYSRESKAGPAAGFATFLTSLDGQKIIQQFGLVPVKIPYRTIQLSKD